MTTLVRKVRLMLAVLIMCCSTVASAYTLSFSPASQTVGLGSKVGVSVWVDEVMPGGLGNYDFEVLFDPALLSFDQAIDQFGLGVAMGLGTTLGGGRLLVSDFSLDDPAALLATQGDRLLLFSLVFDTLAVGADSLTFDSATLGDVEGNSVKVDTTGFATINIGEPAQVPEPGDIVLLLTALVALSLTRLKAK